MTTHTYQHLPPGMFRLMAILPGEQDYKPRIRLETHTLRRPPIYKAISYCWGKYPPDQLIDCDDGTMVAVTETLFDCLLRARDFDEEVYVWADQICTSQSDSPEKADQVRRMAAIFNKADEVIVWLGRSGPETRHAFKLISDICSGVKPSPPSSDSEDLSEVGSVMESVPQSDTDTEIEDGLDSDWETNTGPVAESQPEQDSEEEPRVDLALGLKPQIGNRNSRAWCAFRQLLCRP